MIAININDNDIFDKMIGNEEEVIIKRKNKTDDLILLTAKKYNEILENDFKESFIKYIYSKDPKDPKNEKKYSKLKVRVGRLRNEEREAIQYIGYVEGV